MALLFFRDFAAAFFFFGVTRIRMPASRSKKKKAAMTGKPHRQRPDVDNLGKALFDALFKEDSCIAQSFARKFWDDGKGARMEVHISP